MRGRNYTVSGMGGQTFNNLEDHSTLSISGMGAVTINGSIGQHVSIEKSGMGALNINGTVHPTVKLEVSGMGAVNFRSRPPEAVLDNMDFSGMGTVNVPGGYQKKQASYSSSYSYEPNNTVMNIGGVRMGGVSIGNVNGGVMRNLIMDSNGMRYTNANGEQVYIPNGGEPIINGKPASARAPQKDTLSEATQAYLDRLRKQSKRSVMIEEMRRKQSPAKLASFDKSFEKFNDPLTAIVMDEPVILNGHAYDLSTLTKLSVDADGYRKDPLLTYKFTLQNLQPAQELLNDLETTLKTYTQEWLNSTLTPTATVAKGVLHGYSTPTQTYIDSFKNKPKNSEVYQNIFVSSEDRKAFDACQDFFDSVSLELIDIPVAVNGNTYDLQTLLNQPEHADGQREEPNTRILFYLRDIQPARHIANQIQKELEKFQKKQAALESAVAAHIQQPTSKPQAENPLAMRSLPENKDAILRAEALRLTEQAEKENAEMQAALMSFNALPNISSAPNAVLFQNAKPSVTASSEPVASNIKQQW